MFLNCVVKYRVLYDFREFPFSIINFNSIRKNFSHKIRKQIKHTKLNNLRKYDKCIPHSL